MQLSKHILWLDCTAGALAGTVVLLFSAWFSDLYALPQQLILLIGAVNLLYASYSFSLAVRARRPRLLLIILILANALWSFTCLAFVVVFTPTLTLFGTLHLIAEACFVGGLALLEWRWRNQLITAA